MEQLAWGRRCLAMRRLQISSSEAAAHGKRRWLVLGGSCRKEMGRPSGINTV
jgi:hypothetical protein